MSMHTKASILWVLLLQSRKFAIGDMEVLASFTTMHSDLCAKKANISHAEVPAALLPEPKHQSNGNKRKEPDQPSDPPPGKRQKDNNKNCWHNLLRAKLETPLEKAGFPTFTAILKFCNNADPSSIIPRDGKVCTPNIFFGRCQHGLRCTKQHRLATDSKADKILTMVERFINEPEKLVKGQ